MKKFTSAILVKVLTVLSTIGAISHTAHAVPITGQISFGGYAQSYSSATLGDATGVKFENSLGTSYGAGDGSFAGYGCTSSSSGCQTIHDITNFASQGPVASFLTAFLGQDITFDLSSISSVSHQFGSPGDTLKFTALGTINYAGYDRTQGEFTFTAQGTSIVPYSATLIAGAPRAAVPEPASIALLGLGLVGFAASRRKSANSKSA